MIVILLNHYQISIDLFLDIYNIYTIILILHQLHLKEMMHLETALGKTEHYVHFDHILYLSVLSFNAF
jgi:hypothetical protein